MSSGKEIQKRLYLKDYTEADKIIRYLVNSNDDTIELTDREKEKLTLLKKVHGYRSQYSRKGDVIAILIQVHGVKERQAYNIINECEYVFGSVTGVNKDYERNFLIDASMKNIEIAMASRNSLAITKALTLHYKVCGLDEFIPEMPDFAKLEPHTFKINLPPGMLKIMESMVKLGTLNLADFIPAESLNTSQIQQADEINE